MGRKRRKQQKHPNEPRCQKINEVIIPAQTGKDLPGISDEEFTACFGGPGTKPIFYPPDELINELTAETE